MSGKDRVDAFDRVTVFNIIAGSDVLDEYIQRFRTVVDLVLELLFTLDEVDLREALNS